MNARHGKIARLPLAIREELNRRLQSGQLSPALLPWLNQLPETNTILAEHFGSQPISRQNLSEWRQGGYRDWLKHQERELLIRRLAEEGTSLKKQEGEDLFESFARIAAAELFADLNALDELHGEKRWQRLRSLTRELASLQREYNRSRQVELAWEKWNDQFKMAPLEENPARKSVPKIFSPIEQSAGLSQNPVDAVEVPKLHPLPLGEGRGEGDRSTNNASVEPATQSTLPVKVDQTTSKEFLFPWQHREAEMDKFRTYITRKIHHRRCEHRCICKTCHPETSDYPHREALRDHTEAAGRGVQSFWRGNVMINITALDCACPCDCHQPASVNKSAKPTREAPEERQMVAPGKAAKQTQPGVTVPLETTFSSFAPEKSE